jgi:hypothetical protein
MKYGLDIFWIVIIIVAFGALAVLESYVFDYFPPQIVGDTTIEQWKADFQIWALGLVVVAGMTIVLWYVLAQRFFKIEKPQSTEKRWIWILFFLLPIISVIVAGVFFAGRAESRFVLPFFVLNGVGPYYLATLLFSPSSFKYIPWGASRIRRW